MSLTLLKQGLELFNDDIQPPKDKKKKKSTDVMAQICTKKTGIKKQLRNLKRQEEQRRQAKKKLKPIEPVSYKEVDNTEENISFLEKLDRLSAPKAGTVEKIMVHSRGPLAKNQPKKEVAEAETSIFSDRDFDIFDQTYQVEQDFWKQK